MELKVCRFFKFFFYILLNTQFLKPSITDSSGSVVSLTLFRNPVFMYCVCVCVPFVLLLLLSTLPLYTFPWNAAHISAACWYALLPNAVFICTSHLLEVRCPLSSWGVL